MEVADTGDAMLAEDKPVRRPPYSTLTKHNVNNKQVVRKVASVDTRAETISHIVRKCAVCALSTRCHVGRAGSGRRGVLLHIPHAPLAGPSRQAHVLRVSGHGGRVEDV
jgi:hypothetical protein